MTQLLIALNQFFSSAPVAGALATYETGQTLYSLFQAARTHYKDDSIEKKIIDALDKGLCETCRKLNWEYDQLAVLDIDINVANKLNNENDLICFFQQIIGPSFTTESARIWIDCFDEQVARDQVLFNYLDRKHMHNNSSSTIDYTSKDISIISTTPSDASAYQFLPTADDDLFKSIMKFDINNPIAFNALKEAFDKYHSILPFVGSGISAFTYPTWRNMLLQICDMFDNQEIKLSVLKFLEENLFLDAAQYLSDTLGYKLFLKTVRNFFSEELIQDELLKQNAAYYVPQICHGNCLTTNYDRVLEHACTANNIPYDTAGITEIYKLNTYYRNPSLATGMIFKIHGDILSNNNQIILTKDSYQRAYGDNGDVQKELKKWINGRQFLFIGSSLFNDEPIKILMSEVKEGIENYAFYPCSKEDTSTLRKKLEDLGIFPIFYDKTNHSLLITLLKHLIS